MREYDINCYAALSLLQQAHNEKYVDLIWRLRGDEAQVSKGAWPSIKTFVTREELCRSQKLSAQLTERARLTMVAGSLTGTRIPNLGSLLAPLRNIAGRLVGLKVLEQYLKNGGPFLP